MRFAAGKLVLCIGDGWRYLSRLNLHPERCPKLGSVYTIARVLPFSPRAGDIFLEIEEVGHPQGFPSRWFKPCREANFDLFIARLFGGPVQERPFT